MNVKYLSCTMIGENLYVLLFVAITYFIIVGLKPCIRVLIYALSDAKAESRIRGTDASCDQIERRPGKTLKKCELGVQKASCLQNVD